MLGLELFKTFLKGDANRHYAMKIYLMYDKQDSILSPILFSQINEYLKNLVAPESCKEIHAEIVESFSRFTSDFLQTQIDIAKGLDEGYGAELDQILKPVMPRPPKIVKP
jgi:ABC-type enterochelin transport system permease subunit